ncbi:MAG TPA: hypothetical protein VJ821_05265 [Anaerolineales bacterium]|nr:hypothetical protein [Anaerolineales bacterium]
MSRFGKHKGTPLRLVLCIGLVFTFLVPIQAGVFAQAESATPWIVRTLSTDEYGVREPKGLAFSSAANAFLLFSGDGNITLIGIGEERAATRAIPNVGDDPLNAVFDEHTGSLLVFDRGTSQLVQIRSDSKGLPDAAAGSAQFTTNGFGIANPQGIAVNSQEGHLFILDAEHAQLVSVARHPTKGFDVNQAQHISLKNLGAGQFRGLAFNPGNGHLYVSDPVQKKLYELTQTGESVSSFDLASLGIGNPSAITFAPSVDNTDDASTHNLFMLDERDASLGSQIVELSFAAPAALPAGTPLLSASPVRIINTSNTAWNPSSPDPAGVDYWPSKGVLLISDSEVDEMRPYWVGKNVFLSTTSGNLVGTCSTTAFTGEPTGVAINPNNNHIFFATDYQDTIFEVSLGADGQYCTADDTVAATNVGTLYHVNDVEDVAYGNNTIFIGGGGAAEVYRIPLGANGVLGGGDDGAMTHWDTASLGFADLEGIGFNPIAGTLFIVSTKRTDKYLGEMTTSGTLLRAYDLSFMGDIGNIRSDVTYAPSSYNSAVRSIYIASRGVDNDDNRYENDGKIWEISIGGGQPGPMPTPTPTSSGPGKATLGSPSGITSDTTPRYTWDKVNAATWYYLWVSKINGDGSVTTVHNKWYESSVACGTSTCSVTPAVTLGSGNYRWWIRTWNTGGYGPWSSARNFSISPTPPPGRATLGSPSGTITDTTPSYTWDKVTASTWYYLWISRVNGDGSVTTVHTRWYESSVVCGSSTCSITPAVTLGSGNYRWWIQTWNTGGYGPWSSARNFTVSP